MTDKPVRPTSAKKPKRAPAAKKPVAKARPAAAKASKPISPPPAPATPAVTPSPAPTRPAPSAPAAPARSVAEQLGGTQGVASLSDKISALLIGDPRVNHALFGTPRGEVVEKVKSLLSVAVEEAEEDLHALFAPLREKGFKEGQFAHLLTHVKAAAKELGHPEELAHKISAATEKARKKVFNR
ncbi:MAG: hypothetical protein RLZZ627_2083 [Pseudomonadota bacterium]|jgi:hypothetical protein